VRIQARVGEHDDVDRQAGGQPVDDDVQRPTIHPENVRGPGACISGLVAGQVTAV
jgi:hypothetical protein